MHVNAVSLRDIIFRELELIKGLLTDRFQISILPLTTFLLSSMIKPVGEGAQREGVGNDEMDALCMELYFQTLSLCLDKHNVQTHRSYRYRSPCSNMPSIPTRQPKSRWPSSSHDLVHHASPRCHAVAPYFGQ
jgi:hypothetical protein